MPDHRDGAAARARRDFENAFRQGSLRKLTQAIRGGCNDLVPAGVVLDQLQLQNRKDLGLQHTPLNQIVGSTGRHRDFDLAFLPCHRRTETRWTNIARAHHRGANLPPVLLYKVGNVYFVEDGNHRVSVARKVGRHQISAHVIQIDSSALTPEPACQRLGFRVARNNPDCR